MCLDNKINKPIPKRKFNENITKKLSSRRTNIKN